VWSPRSATTTVTLLSRDSSASYALAAVLSGGPAFSTPATLALRRGEIDVAVAAPARGDVVTSFVLERDEAPRA